MAASLASAFGVDAGPPADRRRETVVEHFIFVFASSRLLRKFFSTGLRVSPSVDDEISPGDTQEGGENRRTMKIGGR